MSKAKGDIGELTFLLAAKKLGFNVLSPYSSVTPYDFILDNGKRLFKIQVKCSNNKHPGSTNKYKVGIGRGKSSKEKYTENDCDYFAIFLIDHNVFYIIPQCEIKTVTLNLYPENTSSTWFKYLNAWHLLK